MQGKTLRDLHAKVFGRRTGKQDFNSLHAQRDACESFIKSQAGEGWRLVKTAYDDGGLSGGTRSGPDCSGCCPTSAKNSSM